MPHVSLIAPAAAEAIVTLLVSRRAATKLQQLRGSLTEFRHRGIIERLISAPSRAEASELRLAFVGEPRLPGRKSARFAFHTRQLR